MCVARWLCAPFLTGETALHVRTIFTRDPISTMHLGVHPDLLWMGVWCPCCGAAGACSVRAGSAGRDLGGCRVGRGGQRGPRAAAASERLRVGRTVGRGGGIGVCGLLGGLGLPTFYRAFKDLALLKF